MLSLPRLDTISTEIVSVSSPEIATLPEAQELTEIVAGSGQGKSQFVMAVVLLGVVSCGRSPCSACRRSAARRGQTAS